VARNAPQALNPPPAQFLLLPHSGPSIRPLRSPRMPQKSLMSCRWAWALCGLSRGEEFGVAVKLIDRLKSEDPRYRRRQLIAALNLLPLSLRTATDPLKSPRMPQNSRIFLSGHGPCLKDAEGRGACRGIEMAVGLEWPCIPPMSEIRKAPQCPTSFYFFVRRV
jgi:hypothetical protein